MTASPRTAKTIEYTKAVRALRAHSDPEKLRSIVAASSTSMTMSFSVLPPFVRRLAREFYQLSLADVRKLMPVGRARRAFSSLRHRQFTIIRVNSRPL